ncbi:ribosome recycling factor, partial [Candidatus Bipolaricaulota bacterium]|nr:ribosome recycling factor [Candidatus Bipolaricaulota bacterium]
MPETVRKDMIDLMDRSIDALKSNLVKIQTGRANPAMIEDVHVSYYGAMTPLKQMATIAAPDANLLVVQPYDKTQMAEVEKAILAADLGLNPQNDGMVIRVKVP